MKFDIGCLNCQRNVRKEKADIWEVNTSNCCNLHLVKNLLLAYDNSLIQSHWKVLEGAYTYKY